MFGAGTIVGGTANGTVQYSTVVRYRLYRTGIISYDTKNKPRRGPPGGGHPIHPRREGARIESGIESGQEEEEFILILIL